MDDRIHFSPVRQQSLPDPSQSPREGRLITLEAFRDIVLHELGLTDAQLHRLLDRIPLVPPDPTNSPYEVAAQQTQNEIRARLVQISDARFHARQAH